MRSYIKALVTKIEAYVLCEDCAHHLLVGLLDMALMNVQFKNLCIMLNPTKYDDYCIRNGKSLLLHACYDLRTYIRKICFQSYRSMVKCEFCA